MRIYDISVGITPNIPVWPGDPPPVVERVAEIADGARSNVTRLAFSAHTGTHIDAPLHFIDGAASVDELPLKLLTGRAYVVDITKAQSLNAKTLEAAGIPPRTKRVLFKTRNSNLWKRGVQEFQEDYVAIDASGAEWLVGRGVQLVGVDYLSVAPFDDVVPTPIAFCLSLV